MNKTVIYVVALVAVSLVAGVLLGGVILSHRLGVNHEYGQMPTRFAHGQAFGHDKGPLEKLSQVLNLSADQKEKLAEILKESRQEVMQIEHKTRETFMEIREKADAKIKAILTPEQQAKMEKLRSDLQQRMRGGRGRQRFMNRAPDDNGPMPADNNHQQPEPRE